MMERAFIDEPVAATRRALSEVAEALAPIQAPLVLELTARTLPSSFDVTALATASIAAAAGAVADWLAWHEGRSRAVRIDGRHVAAAFASERYLSPQGWELPPPWDPYAGDYPTTDGFVRLHTNYAYHRDAALKALSLGADASREELAASVASRTSEDVEAVVVAAGGCAAAMRTSDAWSLHPVGRAVRGEPLVSRRVRGADAVARTAKSVTATAPLAGVKVLDLTRVIAGPVATRFLAAYGADVLRVDPPGFVEVPALLPETTAGKRCTALDLRRREDRGRFEALLAGADVLVHGLRRGALRGLGYDPHELSLRYPGLVVAGVNAYGLSGPWAWRRGFDSLVQMSAGIAAHGMKVAGAQKPVPLPVQALDHATGYLLAAAIARALLRRAAHSEVEHLHVSLARTAAWLVDLGVADSVVGAALAKGEEAPFLEEAVTAWGPVRRIRCPGEIEGVRANWTLAPGPLGRDDARWAARDERLRR